LVVGDYIVQNLKSNLVLLF